MVLSHGRAAVSIRTVRSATVALSLLCVTALLVLTGCADGDNGYSEPARDRPAFQEDFRGDGTFPESAPTAPDDTDSVRREIIQTAYMLLRVEDPTVGAAEATSIAEAVNGRVDDRTERPETDHNPGSAQLTIRVPSDELDNVIEQFRDLGTVEELSVSARDVTSEAIDIDARIDSLTRSVERLQDIIAGAASAEDLIAGENALAQRQAELESLQARRNYLADQVTLSTITLTLEQRPPGDPNPAEGFWGGVIQGWDALISAVRAAIVGAGLALPWLIFFAAGGGIIYVAVRLIGRRR